MYVNTKGGKTYHLFNNREIAKFVLFVIPKLSAAGDSLVGPMPHMRVTDETKELVKIAQKLREKKNQYHEQPPFDDKLPF